MVTVLEQEFFLSEILRRKVFLRRHAVGHLADLAIVETGRLPEVSYVVVHRPFGYPRLTVPWDKVLMISNTEVVLDLEQTDRGLADYEQPPPEGTILLRDHILDKKILDMDDHEVEVVYDIKLVFQSGRLYASEVDFSHYRALRRMGFSRLAKLLADRDSTRRVSWLYVQPLPEQLGSFQGNVKLKVQKEKLADIHPVDLADILEELDGEQRLALFNQLDATHASDTLEEVEPRVQRELISALRKDRAAQLINEMTPAQAADILAILPGDVADDLLTRIDRDKSAKVQQLIDTHDVQAVLYASPNIIKLAPQTRVREVLAGFRELARDRHVVMYGYVVDEHDVLKGVVDIREVIAAEPEVTIAEIMTEHVISLPPDATLLDAEEIFERYDFRAVPVVDGAQHLLGAVTNRDIKSVKRPLE